MAAGSSSHKKRPSKSLPNGTSKPSTLPSKPIELSINLPFNPGTRLHIHLTLLTTNILLLLSTSTLDAPSQQSAMGPFVYAMPDRYNPSTPMSTTLYTSSTPALDFNTRLAKVLVRKTGKLCYVGGNIDLSRAAAGGNVEEEMAAFRAIVEVVGKEVSKAYGT